MDLLGLLVQIIIAAAIVINGITPTIIITTATAIATATHDLIGLMSLHNLH